MTVRLHHPDHGWGRVFSAEVPLLAALYPDAGHPDYLLFVHWDSGSGSYIDAANPDLVVEGAVELADMVSRATVRRGPPLLPDPEALGCRTARPEEKC